MSRKTLHDWLNWREGLHHASIELGLNRIRRAAERLQLLSPAFPIITVAGTNGKGSTVSMLDAIFRAANLKTASYTSPQLLRYNERIQYQGQPVSDQAIIDAFSAIEAISGEVALTWFEVDTLAAMFVFHQLEVDVVILEVGLGGRLDATNLWDADVAIITSIGLDHVEWLGNDRESIGREKAGIMRAGCPVVCGDANPPVSIAEVASTLGANLLQVNEAFSFKVSEDGTWHWSCADAELSQLPAPALIGDFQKQNAASALMVIHLCNQSQGRLRDLCVSELAIHTGLQQPKLAGRLHYLSKDPDVIADVAHNADAATQLAIYLKNQKKMGKTRAVFSILAGKDIESVILNLSTAIDEWHIAALTHERAMPLAAMESAFIPPRMCDQNRSVITYDTVDQALCAALELSKPQDRVVIFGSFLIVSRLMSHF